MPTILYVSASPKGLDRVSVERVGGLITRHLGKETVEVETACTWRAFRRQLATYKPELLHLGFHGKAGDLFFMDDDGQADRVEAARIIEEIGTVPSVKWVLLGACESASTAEALKGVVQAAIGMDGSPSDDAVYAYADGFYEALGMEKGFSEAHAFAARTVRDWCRRARVDDESHIPRHFGQAAAGRPAAPPAVPTGWPPLGSPAVAPAPSRALTAEELEQVIRLAVTLAFAQSPTRDLLLAELPPGFTSSLPVLSQPDLQLRSDLIKLNSLESNALTGVAGRPLAAWLRAAVRLAESRHRAEAADLKRLLLVVEGVTGATTPLGPSTGNARGGNAPSNARGRLQGLLSKTLGKEPNLRSALALSLAVPEASLADHLLSLSSKDIARRLVLLVRAREGLRASAQRLASVALPASNDWDDLRSQFCPDQLVNLRTRHLAGPLCEISLAAVEGRAADLRDPNRQPAAVVMPAFGEVPHLGSQDPIPKLVAVQVLELAGFARAVQPPEEHNLLREANDYIRSCWQDRLEEEALQLYLAFHTADDEALEALRAGLPELWRVQADRQVMAAFRADLKELFQWET
jgi:hypothetical protein